VFVRGIVPASASGVNLGKFGAEKENLRGVINPKQQCYEGTGRAIGGGDTAAPEIEAKRPFPIAKKIAVMAAPIQTSRH